ncbi:hypothetical protein D3C75_605660 [compost metagenome]
MQRLDHGFELGNTQTRQIRVRCIRALRRIVILRIISPVIVRLIQLGLIHALCGEVIDRQQLNMRHPKIGNMIQSGQYPTGTTCTAFGETQILSFAGNPAGRMNGQIPQMKLINNRVHRISQRRLIRGPPLRVRFAQINNRRSVPIHTYSPRVRVRCFIPLVPDMYAVGIQLAFQIAGNRQPPGPPHLADHRQAAAFRLLPGVIQHNLRFLSCWRP